MTPHQPRYGRWMLSVAVLAVIPVSFTFLWSTKGTTPAVHGAPTDEHQDGTEVVTVKVVKPQTGGLERTTTQPGTVRAFEFEEMYAKVSGYLVRQKVDIGSIVKKGEILAEIDAPELYKDELHAKAKLEQARSQVKQMEAHVEAAKAELDAARILIDQRQAEVKRANSSADFRDKRYNRIKQLADYKSVDQNLVDEQFEQREAAQAWQEAAVAGVHTAKADVEAKKAKVVQAQSDLDAAKANVDVADAEVQKAHVFVEFTKIRSHYDGVVTARNYHEGDYIRAGHGDLPLLVVQRIDLMRVIVQIPDTDVPFCRKGDPVDFSISTLPHVKFTTYVVSRISRSQDQNSRTMRIEVDVPNDKDILRDGMYGAVKIHFKGFQDEQKNASKDAVRIPSSALRRESDKVVAYVVRGGAVHAVEVHLGADNGAVAEVLSGLNADDQVVNHPSGQLRDGLPVRIAQESTGH